MFGWLRSRSLRPGDGVSVLEGPYAGKTGAVLAVQADGRIGVYIDECCQPVVDASALKRVRGHDIGRAAREAKLGDTSGEQVRHVMDSRDLGDGF
jgi:ribosomal protein L24